MQQARAEGLPVNGEPDTYPLQSEGGIFLESGAAELGNVVPISERFAYLALAREIDRQTMPSRILGYPDIDNILMAMATDQYRHKFWINEPRIALNIPTPDVYHFPQLGSGVARGFGSNFQFGFSEALPGVRHTTPADDYSHRIDDLAAQDSELIEIISGSEPVILTAASKGAAVAARIALQNLRDNRLNIKGLVFLAPAIFTSDQVRLSSLSKLAFNQARYAVGEVANPFNPSKSWERISALGRNALQIFRHPKSLKSFTYQTLSLLNGFSKEEIYQLLDNYQVGVQLWTDDDIARPDIWEDRATLMPEKGHVNLANVERSVKAIVDFIRHNQMLYLEPNHVPVGS